MPDAKKALEAAARALNESIETGDIASAIRAAEDYENASGQNTTDADRITAGNEIVAKARELKKK